MSEPPSREEAIFHAALEISEPSERAGYVTNACGDDLKLRARIEALLRAGDPAEDFLEQPPAPLPARTLVITAGMVPMTEKAGDRIGRYKLLQQIGEGGCGVVYMAEQEEPVRRRVALKVIKIGMDTKSVVARFEAERQALALMDHPNIAKVLDAGATDTGRPYFVMELVRGLKITEYCDEARLTPPQRLDLFTQVCQAIQHAHQKGIIHRDIKPSNILVTINDGVPWPKVIDFGIAKATTGQRLTDKTLFTAFEQFIGTPAYMSPEQAMMTSLDIDTRSDIYALGVLLYELLTGRTPFDANDLLAAGLDAMRRTICEQEPPRPSTRVSTLPGNELDTVAQRRGLESPRLVSQLRGDLDWIVMKCLEKDRARRYETANGLAMDIHRHLGNEPVLARPPSRLYEFQKTVRRHKVGFAATGAVIAALAAGLGLSAWMYFQEKADRQRAEKAEQEQVRLRRQAQENEKRAETEAAMSEQVAGFLNSVLQGATPEVARGRDTTILREILKNATERLSRELTNQPEVEMELSTSLAWAYGEAGFNKEMEELAGKSVQIARSRVVKATPAFAEALITWGDALRINGKVEQAASVGREALAMARGLKDRNKVAKALQYLIYVFALQGKEAEEESACVEMLEIARELGADGCDQMAEALGFLGGIRGGRGDLAESESLRRQSVEVYKKFKGSDVPILSGALNGLASVLEARGKTDEAKAARSEALAILQKTRGHEQQAAALLVGELAGLGKWSEAERVAREDVEIRKKAILNEQLHPALGLLGDVLLQERKLSEAEQVYRQSLALMEKDDPSYANRVNRLAIVLWNQDKMPEAEVMLKEALAAKDRNPQAEGNVAVLLDNLASALLAQGKIAEAKIEYGEAHAAEQKAWAKAAESGDANALNALAWALATSMDASLRDGKQAVELAKKSVAASDRKNPGTLDTLAAAYAEAGQFTNAVATQQEAIALLKTDSEKKDYTRRLQLYSVNMPFRDFDYDTLLQHAGILLRHQKLTEAETMLREGLDSVRNLPGQNQLSVVRLLQNLEDCLLPQHKQAEADKIYSDFLATAGAAWATNADFLQARGEHSARCARWNEAAADLTRALELAPQDHTIWHSLAPVLVQNGRLDAYREQCRKSLERFGNTTDPPTAERISKDCSILPSSGADFALVGKMTDLAVSTDPNHPAMAWFQTTKALAEYRRGNFAPAVDWARQALDMGGTNSWSWNCLVESQAVLAMAQYQLHQTNQARLDLAKAQEIADSKLAKLDSGDLGVNWLDWIIAQALLREAKALIQTKAER